MHLKPDALPPGQPDPRLLNSHFYVDQFCLIAAGMIALLNLLPGIFTPLPKTFPVHWLSMRSSFAVVTLCAATSLFFSEETQTGQSKRIGRSFAILAVALAAASLLASVSGVPSGLIRLLDRNQVPLRQGSLEFSAAAFLLAGLATLLASSDGPISGRIGDGIAVLLSVTTLSLVIAFLFEWMRMGKASEHPITGLISIPALWCIALLTLVTVCRRAEHGFMLVFWGYGTGSRIARMLAPVILLFPIAREILRARLLKINILPAHYGEAVVTSIGTVLGFILLLFLARQINRMHENIQGLTLKDELTGLHSLRGFHLLAEQSFRNSQRSREPFGVLFVDMDNLKIINDRMGHSVGSVSLVETAKLLAANFRETDIIGRVGGDEFVVAGQFNRQELALAVERLRVAVARKNEAAGQRFSISLSMGYAVTEDIAHETIRSLVAKADQEMYREKSAKKNNLPALAMAKSQAI
jgi:diguanylate cyclase (GGDEF)-like protein